MVIRTRTFAGGVVLAAMAALPTQLFAQSYQDFLIVRNREQPYRSLFQIRAGYKGTDPEGENRSAGLTDDGGLGGFLLFHSKELTRKENWVFDGYAGLDGIYLGLKDDLNYGKKAQTRLEVFGRMKAFYREGFYQDGDYLVSGQYEGRDYGLRVTTAQIIEKGLILDIGAYFKRNEFDRNSQTDLRPDFTIPDDYNTYGGVLTLEQNTVKLDRVLGLPLAGSIMSLQMEYEHNDSDRVWGSSSYRSELPRGFYRGFGRFEFYLPNGKSGVWEIMADAAYLDKADRVTSYHAERMQGYIWADATLGYRMAFAETFILKPFGELQYTKILDESGVSSDQEVFWGGGVDMSLVFGRNMALVVNYSYMNNPSRGWVSIDRDFYGEHQFFIGMDVSFGSGYR